MTLKIFFYMLFMSLSGNSQADTLPKKLLPPCQKIPNCLSSETLEGKQFIQPFKIKGESNKAWSSLKAALNQQNRVVITHESADNIHAEVTSMIFKFVDDVDFCLDKENNAIHIRSASRTDHLDFGINHKRIEALRAQLQKANLIS